MTWRSPTADPQRKSLGPQKSRWPPKKVAGPPKKSLAPKEVGCAATEVALDSYRETTSDDPTTALHSHDRRAETAPRKEVASEQPLLTLRGVEEGPPPTRGEDGVIDVQPRLHFAPQIE